MERYAQRIRELLDEPLVTDKRGCLCPTVLELSSAARTEWISIHDCVEDELGAQGEFRDIRDVAAKAAENVARLAALFHVLEHGAAGCQRRLLSKAPFAWTALINPDRS